MIPRTRRVRRYIEPMIDLASLRHIVARRISLRAHLLLLLVAVEDLVHHVVGVWLRLVPVLGDRGQAEEVEVAVFGRVFDGSVCVAILIAN